jgi:uncharacterized protein (DUF2235 family)
VTKNILVFADGTGNEGGLLPDESRTNVYKLYRATRTGPESIIDPRKQLAFYIPGIGTPTPRHNSLLDRTKEAVRQMFGVGLTEKIMDCYVAIIGVWEPGDRRQFLTTMSADVIKAVKLAALEDGTNAWEIMEEAAKEWLARRKSKLKKKARAG